MIDTATPDSDASPSGWRSLPVWARIGLIAILAIVVAIVAIVLIRVATRVPPIPLGVTAVDDVRPGSCVAEDGVDLDQYTVIPCSAEHPQQIFATADLELDEVSYGSAGEALATFGDEVCDRYLEYRLFLHEQLDKSEYRAYAVAVPTPEQYAAGDTEALCGIARADGSSFTGDAYRAMP